MSREIKFRAWDEENKQFADYEDIEECLSCQNRDGWKSSDGMGCCFGINAVEILADCIIEQYTGLKDKNGKEIYEGDIVKCILGNKPIVFHDCRYWLGETLDDLFVANLRYDIEVVGNVHENPELIGGEE